MACLNFAFNTFDRPVFVNSIHSIFMRVSCVFYLRLGNTKLQSVHLHLKRTINDRDSNRS